MCLAEIVAERTIHFLALILILKSVRWIFKTINDSDMNLDLCGGRGGVSLMLGITPGEHKICSVPHFSFLVWPGSREGQWSSLK